MLSRVTKVASRSSLQPSVPAGRIGSDQKPRLGGRIPDADLGLGRQRHTEIGQDALGIDHRARAVGRRFVPDRRQPQHRPRITRAQGADDEVMNLRRILDRDQVAGDRVRISQRICRFGRIGQKPLLEFGIDPSAGDEPATDVRPDPGLVRLDDLVQRRRIDIALFGQDGFERPHPHIHFGQFRALRMVVGVDMVIRHRCSPRSCGECYGGAGRKSRPARRANPQLLAPFFATGDQLEGRTRHAVPATSANFVSMAPTAPDPRAS